MARLNRLVVPGYPHMLLQRARADGFVLRDDQDASVLTESLMVSVQQTGIAMHGFVLLPDRWLLLVTPESAEALSQTMQSVGRRYVHHVNRRYGQRGSLWASRFCSAVIEGAAWTLPCLSYMDTLPVRLGQVQTPGQYRHGSFRHYAGMHHERHVVAPPEVWRLGNTPFAREAAYAEMVHGGLAEGKLHEIEHAVQRGWALGSPAFVDQLQLLTQRRLRAMPRGRPARNAEPGL